MKTIKEWLNELPEPARSKALKNIADDLDDEYNSSQTEETMSSALLNAFVWSLTPEGGDYWQEIYTSLYLKEQ